MSKPVKNLIVDSYKQRFADEPGVVVVDMRGVPSNGINEMRTALAEKGMRVTLVKNTLARKAIEGTVLEGISDLLEGGCAFVYGGESVVNIARELVEQVKKFDKVQFRGAIMEEQVFGPDEIEALSKYPTREEAIGQLVTLLQSPGRNLAGQLTGAGSKLASIIKAIEEKLEKGEEIKAA